MEFMSSDPDSNKELPEIGSAAETCNKIVLEWREERRNIVDSLVQKAIEKAVLAAKEGNSVIRIPLSGVEYKLRHNIERELSVKDNFVTEFSKSGYNEYALIVYWGTLLQDE